MLNLGLGMFVDIVARSSDVVANAFFCEAELRHDGAEAAGIGILLEVAEGADPGGDLGEGEEFRAGIIEAGELQRGTSSSSLVGIMKASTWASTSMYVTLPDITKKGNNFHMIRINLLQILACFGKTCYICGVKWQLSMSKKDTEIKSNKVSEPIGAVAVDYSDTMLLEDDLMDVPLGRYGFYTSDPVEFEQRVAEIEEALDEVDAGIDDPQKWIQVDDFMAAMRKEHPWL